MITAYEVSKNPGAVHIKHVRWTYSSLHSL